MKGVQAPAAGQPLLLGVRHHGPGSARAVRAALEAARPRVVLVEGPPEADPLIPLAAAEDMRPPVALLAHAVDEPGRSAFWPLAAFSPGGSRCAGRWSTGCPPVSSTCLGHPHAGLAAGRGRRGRGGRRRGGPGGGEGRGVGAEQDALDAHVRIDPLGVLADTAGYDDAERWWEDVVEHRGAGKGTRSRRSLPWRRP